MNYTVIQDQVTRQTCESPPGRAALLPDARLIDNHIYQDDAKVRSNIDSCQPVGVESKDGMHAHLFLPMASADLQFPVAQVSWKSVTAFGRIYLSSQWCQITSYSMVFPILFLGLRKHCCGSKHAHRYCRNRNTDALMPCPTTTTYVITTNTTSAQPRIIKLGGTISTSMLST